MASSIFKDAEAEEEELEDDISEDVEFIDDEVIAK